jgi:hypothetical protein
MCERLEKDLEKPDYLSSESAKQIAREELKQRKKALRE